MKKLLIIYGVVALILFSIGLYVMLTPSSDSNYKEVDGRKIEIITPNIDIEIKYVEFDGHEYVYMSKGRDFGTSMCHSPKCYCLTEYKK